MPLHANVPNFGLDCLNRTFLMETQDVNVFNPTAGIVILVRNPLEVALEQFNASS